MLSVIVPVYNGEKYISETISHIQDSSYRDFEIIIVNDGSQDSSESIILGLAKQDARIKYYFKENGGIVSARNFGLDRANGQYICFVDQDDIVMPNMFELLIDALNDTKADFAQGGKTSLIEGMDIAYNSDMQRKIIEKGEEEYQLELGGAIFRGGIDHLNAVDGAIWNKIYRKEFLDHYAIRCWKWCDYEDDWLFVIECMRNSNRIVTIKSTVYVWRVNMKSESHDRIKKDIYIEDLYDKHCKLRTYLLEVFRETKLPECDYFRFEKEQIKQTILWGLSNETGRGIQGRSINDSTRVMKNILSKERKNGRISFSMIIKPLPITVYGQTGLKKVYYVFRDILLTSLLVFRMEWIAVCLNKYILHGRWHI